MTNGHFSGTPEGTRLHCRPGMDGNEGVMPVEPGMSNSPPDCCIEIFEYKNKKERTPEGVRSGTPEGTRTFQCNSPVDCCSCPARRALKRAAQNAPVAQLDRVTDYESVGQGFESLPAYQNEHLRVFVLFCFYTRIFQCNSPVDCCSCPARRA